MTSIHHPDSCSGTLFFDVNETLLDTKELNQVVTQRLGNRPERAEAWFTSLLHHSLVGSVTGRMTPSGIAPSRISVSLIKNRWMRPLPSRIGWI